MGVIYEKNFVAVDRQFNRNVIRCGKSITIADRK
jgi:hypothetical protein